MTRLAGQMKHLGIVVLFGNCLLSLSLVCPAATVQGASEGAPRNQLCFSAGYFANVHANFYPTFQSGFVTGAAFCHDFQSHYGYEIRSGVRLELAPSRSAHYVSLSPAFLVTRTIISSHRFHWRVGAGPGMGFRDYSDTYVSASLEQQRYHQREFSLMAVGETGLDLYLGDFLFNASAVFERHLTGDPSRGDFGDTGGFTFLLGAGRRF